MRGGDSGEPRGDESELKTPVTAHLYVKEVETAVCRNIYRDASIPRLGQTHRFLRSTGRKGSDGMTSPWSHTHISCSDLGF